MTDDTLNLPMFFGFVGMFIMLMFWPGLGKTICARILLNFWIFFETFWLKFKFLVVMHLTGVEEFELPTKEQFLYLGLNGLIGTVRKVYNFSLLPNFQVICELIWIYACFLTSPLQGTLALSLINPGSILADYVSVRAVKSSLTFFVVITWSNIWTAFFPGLGAELGRLFRHCLF